MLNLQDERIPLNEKSTIRPHNLLNTLEQLTYCDRFMVYPHHSLSENNMNRYCNHVHFTYQKDAATFGRTKPRRKDDASRNMLFLITARVLYQAFRRTHPNFPDAGFHPVYQNSSPLHRSCNNPPCHDVGQRLYLYAGKRKDRTAYPPSLVTRPELQG